MSDYTRFDIPISRDKFGSVTMKPVVVQNRLLPAMAQIIESATRPILLRQQYVYSLRHMERTLGESVLQQIRDRIRYDLESTMRADALKMNTAIITPIEHEETTADGEVLFVASAVGMNLIDRIEL